MLSQVTMLLFETLKDHSRRWSVVDSGPSVALDWMLFISQLNLKLLTTNFTIR